MIAKTEINKYFFSEPNGKKTIWIPYLSSLEKLGRQGVTWTAVFNGGELNIDLKQTVSLMFYGKAGDIPAQFLFDAAQSGTSIIFHSRRSKEPILLSPARRGGSEDILEAQILCRANERKRAVVAKALVSIRLQQMRWRIPIPDGVFKRIRAANGVEAVRAIEAGKTAGYWRAYFEALYLDADRRSKNAVSDALDALSMFSVGLVLRWITLHRLSPYHGFLHEPTTYMSLVYDLIEPCRHWMEQAVFVEYLENGEEGLTARATARYKQMLDEWVEVPNLQVEATRKNILHGNVLALRAYLVGDMRRIIFPRDALEREKGCPVKATYAIPGAKKRRR